MLHINQTQATRDLPAGPGKSGAGKQINLERRALKVHPAVFPVELPQAFLTHYAGASEIVLDPFLGSGTTLIAAERLGRICYGMEIEPRYVDVAIARWEAETGESAVLVECVEPAAPPEPKPAPGIFKHERKGRREAVAHASAS